MNGFQFTASLVGSLAWPIVVVAVVVVLRKPLSQIFSSLTLNKLSYKDWQFDFGEKVAMLTSSADKANIPDVVGDQANRNGDQSVTSTGATKQENQKEELIQLESQMEIKVQDLGVKLKELEEQLVAQGNGHSQQDTTKKRETELLLELEKERLEAEKKNLEFQKILAQLVLEKDNRSKDDEIKFLAITAPLGSVVVAWSQLEQEIVSAARRLISDVSLFSNRISAVRCIEELLRADYIDKQTATILNDMRGLRNKAAHRSVSEEDITSSEALEYTQLAQRMIQLLSSLKSTHQFRVGDKVRHTKFGGGVVVKSEVVDTTEFVDVQFNGTHGKKRLSMDFAKLEKL